MKIKFIYFLLLSFISYSGMAQSISGKILDSKTGAPLQGATVSFLGKNVRTDRDGSYSVACGKPGTLTISYVGYQTIRRTVSDCNSDLSLSLISSDKELDQVEITAVSNANKSLLNQPQAITKLGEAELKRGTGIYFDDIINLNVPGVSFERRTVNGGQSFNIRGYGNGTRGTRGASSNFDGQGYKVYLNGIPVTDAEGITVMDDIDFGSIGNVEVAKGPAGTLYGLAIAGAVNLKTVKPEKGKTSIGQDIMVGDYGLRRYTTHFQTGGERSSLLLNYGNQKSKGYFIHNASHKDFVNAILEFRPKDKQTFNAYIGFTDSYDDRGGEQTIAQYEAKSDTGNLEYVKRNGHSHLVAYRAGVGHNYTFTNWLSNFTTIFGTGLVSDVSSAGGWTDKLSLNYGARSAFDTKFSLSKDVNLSGITGFELQRQNAQTLGYSMKKNPTDPSTAANWKIGDPYWVINANTGNTNTVSSTNSLFTEWTLSLPQDLSFTAGVGVSNMTIRLDDRFNATTATRPAIFDTSYKNLYSPHFAINKVFNKKVSVYASYSTGYKAPVSANFFVPIPAVGANAARAKIDSALKPEKGVQYEIGTKGSLINDRFSYELSAFHTVYTDKMTAVAVKNPNDPAGVTLYSITTNGGKQNHKGLEGLMKYTVYSSAEGFLRSVRPFANFTLSDFKYEDFKFHQIVGIKDSVIDFSGHRVAGVPKFTANAGLDFLLQYGIYGNITYAYRDKQSIVSTEEFYAPKYALLNSKLGIQQMIGKHFDFDLFVGVNNITNQQYPIKVFVNQLGTPLNKTSGDAYIPGPRKANAYAGLNIKYNF